MKRNRLIFLLAGLALGSGLVIGCLPKEKKEAPPAAAQPPAKVAAQIPAPPIQDKTGPISLDFDHAPLSEIAQFVTQQTGKGLILNGAEQKPISWIEYNIPRQKLFDAFTNILPSFDLVIKPANEAMTAYTIAPLEEMKVAYKLNFATSQRGTFFLLGSTIYPKETFPFPVKYESGHWFAIVPKCTADQLAVKDGNNNTKG